MDRLLQPIPDSNLRQVLIFKIKNKKINPRISELKDDIEIIMNIFKN